MTRILDTIADDLGKQKNSIFPGSVLERISTQLLEAHRVPGEPGLAAASAAVESLHERLLQYRQSFIDLQAHEQRHNLVEAFAAYSEVLRDLNAVLSGQEALYDPRLIETLAQADQSLLQHRLTALQVLGPDL